MSSVDRNGAPPTEGVVESGHTSWRRQWIDDAFRDRGFVSAVLNLPVVAVMYLIAAAVNWVSKRWRRR